MENGIGLAAAIDRVVGLANDARSSELVRDTPERKGAYYLIGPDGKADLRIAAADWHGEKLATPADLRAFIETYKREGSATFYDENVITFVYDQADRRDRAYCNLKLSPQYQWLLKESQAAMPQQTLVRTLRIIFRGCQDGNLLSLVRNLKFSNAAEGAGAIQQGRESLSRSIVNEVRGEAAIPEETALIIPVFENHPYSARIPIAVEVMPEERVFKLTPYPMALKLALDEALGSVAELLSAEGMPPLYRGYPS